jgi:hypothetical protein
VLEEIFLVVVFGLVKPSEFPDLSIKFSFLAVFPVFLCADCCGFLLCVMEENDRFVLVRTDGVGGVMVFPENIEKALKGDYRRVEVQLQGLGMVSQIMICRLIL